MSKIYTIGEVAKLNQSSIATNDVFESIEYLDTSSLTENKINNLQTLNKNFPSRAKRKVKNNTILYSTVRPNLEHHGILQNIDCSRLIASTGFTTIDVDESIANPKYVYYKLTQPFITQYLQTVAESAVSAYPSIKPNDISTLKFRFPELEIQRKIAGVLSALDDKIELNRKINAELEQMARTLYDYWFVQFDFPDAHGKPYKTSGGPMKSSPELNRQIPTDWEVLKLEDRLVFDKGTEPGASAYSDTKDDENDTTFYRVGDIDGNSSTYINASLFKPKLVSSSDVIVTFDGSVGKIGIGLDGAISGGLRHIYDKEGKISNATIYSIFRNEYIQKTIERYATGSVILHASSSIKYLAIPFDEKVVTEFQKITQPLFDKIIANRQQSQKLAELRDWLLPMLMNGQVSVE